jgi:hypothetical protein
MDIVRWARKRFKTLHCVDTPVMRNELLTAGKFDILKVSRPLIDSFDIQVAVRPRRFISHQPRRKP